MRDETSDSKFVGSRAVAGAGVDEFAPVLGFVGSSRLMVTDSTIVDAMLST
jgi:hypothetical protein